MKPTPMPGIRRAARARRAESSRHSPRGPDRSRKAAPDLPADRAGLLDDRFERLGDRVVSGEIAPVDAAGKLALELAEHMCYVRGGALTRGCEMDDDRAAIVGVGFATDELSLFEP